VTEEAGAPKICQLDGCDVALSGRQFRWCSRNHLYRGREQDPERREYRRRFNTHYMPRYRLTTPGVLSDLRANANRRGNR